MSKMILNGNNKMHYLRVLDSGMRKYKILLNLFYNCLWKTKNRLK